MGKAEAQRPGAAGLQLDGHYVVRERSDVPAAVLHVAGAETHRGHSGIQVQVPVIILGRADSVKIQQQASQRQVLHPVGPHDELVAHNLGGLFLLAGENQIAHLLQVFQRAGTVVVVRSAAPESFVVELDFVVLRPAEHHGAHVGIAQGQRLQPDLGRAVVPEPVLRAGNAGGREDRHQS